MQLVLEVSRRCSGYGRLPNFVQIGTELLKTLRSSLHHSLAQQSLHFFDPGGLWLLLWGQLIQFWPQFRYFWSFHFCQLRQHLLRLHHPRSEHDHRQRPSRSNILRLHPQHGLLLRNSGHHHHQPRLFHLESLLRGHQLGSLLRCPRNDDDCRRSGVAGEVRNEDQLWNSYLWEDYSWKREINSWNHFEVPQNI